jgi:3-phenylpropionate/cinnamic acid dioxygenase small subunit
MDLQSALLRLEISDFLYREAQLLDDRKFDEWLGLLSEDLRYQVPMRLNVRLGGESAEETRPGSEICWFDESKATLAMRVAQLNTGMHWAEEPLSRVSHFVSNVFLHSVRLPEVTVSSHFLIYRNRVDSETDLLAGRRQDVLRQRDGSWQIASRYVVLDQSVLLEKNLTIFF